MKRVLTLFLSLFSLWLFAAPYPVTGSSIILNNKMNMYLWPLKFDLNLQRTAFEMDLSQNDQDKWIIKTLDPDIQVYMRIKQLGPKDDYDKSLKTWLKEYEKSGFQILSQQIPKKNADRGWIHLQDQQTEKQLVQYFRYQNKIWIYFNCIGQKNKLSLIKQTCESLHNIVVFR